MKRLVAFVLYTSFLFADKIVFTDELVIYGELTNISDVHALDPRTGSEQEVYFKVSKATLRKLEKNKNNHIIGIFDENVVIFNMNVIREFDLESSDNRLLSKISKAGKRYRINPPVKIAPITDWLKACGGLCIFTLVLLLSAGP